MHILEGVNGSYCYASVCERDPTNSKKNIKNTKCIGRIKNGEFLPNRYLTSLLSLYSLQPSPLSAFEKMIVDTTLGKYGQSVAQIAKEQLNTKTAGGYRYSKKRFKGVRNPRHYRKGFRRHEEYAGYETNPRPHR